MTNANVAAALDELRREYAEVGARVERMQHDSTALETRHERLSKAIESLEGLTAPEDSGAEGAEQANGTPPSTKVDADWAVEEEPHVVLEEEENEPLVPAARPLPNTSSAEARAVDLVPLRWSLPLSRNSTAS